MHDPFKVSFHADINQKVSSITTTQYFGLQFSELRAPSMKRNVIKVKN